ncbi:pitrilysin family protein [Halobacteriovorax sp. HLS]|uniref:M16 family metallopeptidase n=1 Tax=Halobacteriovorax sp. HLS TaxID=2234000 RepID=UPI000FD89DF8|nr:pitrilysin family protein [Halobacteriovorax sp. HLS]
MQHEQVTLKNGLKTLLVDFPGSTSSSVQIWFKAGSALETKKDEGIAHFLEHMFFKGTPTRPGAAIAHEVESFGGEVNAFTSFDYTCYYINSPSSKINQTADILMDMVANPMFKEDDFKPEIGVVFEEYRRSQDNSNQYSFQKIQKGSFTGGYAHPILGTEKTILKFNKSQLQSFRKKYYNLENAMLVISGDLKNKDKILKTVEKYKLPKGESSNFPNFKLKSTSNIDLHTKDVRMSQLTLTIQGPSHSDKNAAAEDLALSTLGHGETSRLHKSLVLDGTLSNGASSSTMFMAKGGVHFLRVSFPQKNLKKVLKRLETIFKDLVKEGLNKDEINRIKNQYVASKVYEKESLESYAFSLGHGYAQTGDINCEDEFINKIRKTSVAEVNATFKEIFSRPIHISLQLPRDAKEDSSKLELEKFHEKISKLKNIANKQKSKFKETLSKFDPQVKVIEIKKGISLLYRHNPLNPTFVLHTYIKGGLTEETTKNNGIYHLLSATISKGHESKSYEDLKNDLENKSAHISGFTGKNAYGITLHGQTEHCSELFSDFFKTLTNPSFEERFLDHEKELTLRHLENQKEDPVRHCFGKVNEMAFNNHPYSFNILGNEKNLSQIKRKNVLDLHRSNLEQKEILISYCGDLSHEEVISLVQQNTQDLGPRKKSKLIKKPVKPIVGKNHFIEFDREQTQIFHFIPSAKLGSKENIVLKMIATHLSGQSSELFVEVRDRQGLCYSAQPIHFTALEAGYWGIYMASGHDKVTPAVKAIKDIIERLKTKGLSKKDFNRIKKMIDGQSLLNVQTNEDYANIYSVPTLQGLGLDWYYKGNAQINDITYEEFQKEVKKAFSKKWNTIIVGRTDM